MPSNQKSSSTGPKFSRGNAVSLVSVYALDKVILNDGFTGSCCPVLPQYFINAILLGDCHETETGSAKADVNAEPEKSELVI